MDVRLLLSRVNSFSKKAQVLAPGQSAAGKPIVEDPNSIYKKAIYFKELLHQGSQERRVGWGQEKALIAVQAIIDSEPISKADKQWAVMDVEYHYPQVNAAQFKEMLDAYGEE